MKPGSALEISAGRRGSTPDRKSALLTVLKRQRRVADGLVQLEGYSVARLTTEVELLRAELLDHHAMDSIEKAGAQGVRRSGATREGSLLERDHAIFPQSLDELDGLLEVVRRDSHGGNRQALGQYWRILLEAVERHMDEEGRATTTGLGPTRDVPRRLAYRIPAGGG